MTEELELVIAPAPGPFFRFTDEAAWLNAAREAGFITTVTDDDGNESEQLQPNTQDHAIDVVGTITVGGEWDEDGNKIKAPTTLDGYHINYLGDLPTGWKAFAVTPKKPYRVFA